MTGQPRRFRVLIEGEAEKAVRRIQLRAFQAITSATPVATGYARSGWTPTTEGTPDRSRDPAPTDNAAARAAAGRRFAENTARANRIAASYVLTNGRVYLTNGVPYVVFLNEGSSSQAPARFVERAIAAAVASVGR